MEKLPRTRQRPLTLAALRHVEVKHCDTQDDSVCH